jgi:hypothetical protein
VFDLRRPVLQIRALRKELFLEHNSPLHRTGAVFECSAAGMCAFAEVRLRDLSQPFLKKKVIVSAGAKIDRITPRERRDAAE